MKTIHKPDCSRVFKRYDLSCPRCQELAKGSAPRPGYSEHYRSFDAQSLAAIRSHSCAKSGCGPVCTFGDW